MHIARLVPGMETSDGAGVRLTRMIGTPQVDMIDPFLMLDRFDNEDPGAYIGGFPEHPHRGFETVTIMLDGKMRHRDSTGGEGVIGPGDVQWMTAGRGIIHSEMPEQIEGRMRGFQLWVNLPAADKMKAPGYQDITVDTIPVVEEDGVRVHVVAGSYGDAAGPAKSHTPIRLLRIEMEPNATWSFNPEAGRNSFFCLYEGSVSGSDNLGSDKQAQAPSLAVLAGTGETRLAAGPEGAALFLGEGTPIGEPVARYGPFVMNSRDELIQAFQDFESGRFGN
ncbi:pirin family protein [Hwanghaeella sp.]|uniref:pirin family protein n=1 Tax=Hwanghaeella sp. TaxID=2605943 RepID=UPI003CCC2A5F